MVDDDRFDLQRFVAAQDAVYDNVLAELGAGRKRSHWMWFVFPQLRGLGRSATAQFYGIASLDEAVAYLAHPVLGPRLLACVDLVLALEGRTLHEVFGSPDDAKFCSCMSLFAVASGETESTFHAALRHSCDGQLDDATLRLLGMDDAG